MMRKNMALALALGLLLGVAGCSGNKMESEPESGGSIMDPVCMPDGSVSYNLVANQEGTFGKPLASKENCPWNKKK